MRLIVLASAAHPNGQKLRLFVVSIHAKTEQRRQQDEVFYVKEVSIGLFNALSQVLRVSEIKTARRLAKN